MKNAQALALSLLVAAGADFVFSAAPATGEEARSSKKEGPPELRNDYFARRRVKRDDPNFNAAQARAEAMRERGRNGRLAPLVLGTTWTAMGPTPIALGQTPTDGAQRSNVSGRCTGVAVASGGSPVYLGTAQGGVWKSIDSGTSWTFISDTFLSQAIGAVAIDPSNASTIYAGTGEGNGGDSYGGVGIYKSTTSGASWTGPVNPINTPGEYGVFSYRGITSIVVDRTNSSVVLCTTIGGTYGPGHVLGPTPPVLPNRGVYKSTDGGTTWANKSLGDMRASNVVQDPVTPTRWFAAMAQVGLPAGSNTFNGGLLRSTDNGDTWIQLAGNPQSLPGCVNPLPPNSGIVGQEWGRAYVTASAANAAAQSTIYVGNAILNDPASPGPPPNPLGAAGSGNGRIFRSVDSGLNWTELTSAKAYCAGQCGYDMPVYSPPLNPTIVYHGGAGNDATVGGANPTSVASFRSSVNSGGSWTDRNRSGDGTTAIHADLHFITSQPGAPATLWVASDGGIWRSTDSGANWQSKNSNLSITQFNSVALHPTLANVAYGGTQDNGTNSWNNAATWFHSDDGDGGFAVIDQVTPTNVAHTYYNLTGDQIGVVPGFAGTATAPAGYGSIVGACAACAAGSAAKANGINLADRVLFYAPIAMDRGTGAAAQTLYFGTNKLYKATSFFVTAAIPGNNTSVFVDISAGNDFGSPTGSISAIETIANSTPGLEAQVIFVGSDQGNFFRSTNGGTTWNGGGVGSLFISDIVVDTTTTGSLASTVMYFSRAGFDAVAGKNVQKSTDGGVSWADSGAGIPNIPVNALVVDPVLHTRVWAGTDAGVWVSLDSGATWNAYNTGLPNVAVFDLRASVSGDQLVAATYGRGMYRLTPLTPVDLVSFEAE